MNLNSRPFIMIRGGGDLASGVALRLFHCGFQVLITEISQPLAVRRNAAFAQAVFDKQTKVEDVEALLCSDVHAVMMAIDSNKIAVMVDPQADCVRQLELDAIVDCRMIKIAPSDAYFPEIFTIGLGPGFTVGLNAHAVVETNRGPDLGRVFWKGSAQEDTTLPEAVNGHITERILRAPRDGFFTTAQEIGDLVAPGQEVGRVNDTAVLAELRGVIRGLLYPGLHVQKGMKIGDIDPRCDPKLCVRVTDKSLAIGGGVLEALLSRIEIWQKLAARK